MTAVDSINLGKASRLNDAQGRYVEFCKSSFTDLDLNGLSILLDCANGATYSVAPKVFEELGASVKTISPPQMVLILIKIAAQQIQII